MDRPRIFLGMPRYGAVEFGAAARFFASSTRTNIPEEFCVDIVRLQDLCTSATPHTFNGLIAQALDWYDDGRATHYASIHSDVMPQCPWLNQLWAEMRLSGATLVATNIAIKNESGKTSTAVGQRSDPWRVSRWITRDDLRDLPGTFSTADVAKTEDDVLLINTGLILVDLSHDCWRNWTGFEYRTRIIKGPNGRECQFQPEDWLLSRYLDRCGAKYVATSTVRCEHIGPKGYTTE
jgi:hypothetical protein